MTMSSKAWGENLLAERARRLAERPTLEGKVERRRVCVVETDGALYGLPVESISRVIPNVTPAPLANAEPALLGIISRGGGFALAYELAALMGARPSEPMAEGHLILLRQTRPLTALKVERTFAVQDVELLSAEEAQSLAVRTGVATYGRHDDNRIISIIDIAALMTAHASMRSGG